MTEDRMRADEGAQDGSPTFRLVYRSHSRIPADERREALADIFDVARPKNRRLGVTGALLITDHWFVQALEGDEEQVRALFETIRRDPRHDDVTVVAEETPDGRVFSKWSMARVSADGGADIPLHTHEGRIGRAAPLPLERAQMELLKRMRNTIGADVV